MWDENVVEALNEQIQNPRYESIDEVPGDDRCKASSYRQYPMPRSKTYETFFGPGGYNRCIGSAGHANPRHKDEWGNVFEEKASGGVKKIREEKPEVKS